MYKSLESKTLGYESQEKQENFISNSKKIKNMRKSKKVATNCAKAKISASLIKHGKYSIDYLKKKEEMTKTLIANALMFCMAEPNKRKNIFDFGDFSSTVYQLEIKKKSKDFSLKVRAYRNGDYWFDISVDKGINLDDFEIFEGVFLTIIDKCFEKMIDDMEESVKALETEINLMD